jgi:16S rRNA (uracil1498-N3)-methyltransferase
MHRAFVSELPTDGHLDRETYHRFSRVLRLKNGEPIELFDGHGNCLQGLFDAPLRDIKVTHIPTDTPAVTLMQALVSMDKLEGIVQHATELGVSEIVLFKAERSQPGQLKLERLIRIAQDAARQSGRAWVPGINLEKSPLTPLFQRGDAVFLCDPNASESFPLFEKGGPGGISIIIGPEGGFSESERAQFQIQGAKPVRLAKYVLRTETAGLTALSQIQGKLL